MYSLRNYGTIITDPVRIEAYVEAMRRLITPESVVVDIGAGTGFFALLACHYGAKHVYAIETNNAIRMLRQQAIDNNFADRITVYHDMSTHVELPEPADLILSDLRGGSGPLFQQHVLTLVDARQRLLKPDGVLLPARDTLFAALVSDAESYDKLVKPWSAYDLDMSSVRTHVLNQVQRQVPQAEQVVSAVQEWGMLEYGITEDPTLHKQLEWTIDQPQTVHFISTWFEAQIFEDIRYNTSPFTALEQRPKSYSGMYIPFLEPLILKAGDVVSVDLWGRYIPSRGNYTYVWKTHVDYADGSAPLTLQQSTFFNDQLTAKIADQL